MASISGNSSETRDKIKRVQEFLDQEIERVKELKNLLSTSEEKVTQLERELAKCKAAIAPTSINSCPPEILSMIFKLSVLGDTDTHHIGRFLLVCRRWHALIMNDPQLWNNIQICVPRQWDILSWSKSTRLYINSCMERSHPTRLNIELDFRALRTTEQQIKERFRDGFLQMSASDKVEVGQDRLRRWLEDLDYDTLNHDIGMTIRCLPKHAVYLLDRLVGMGGEVGPRCESFTLQFPSSDELVEMIWDRIALNITNLSRIHLTGINWEDIYWGDVFSRQRLRILSLPQVKDLRMKTLTGWEQFLSFDPSLIQRLAVDLAFEEDFFLGLARFSQLRTLALSSSGISEDVDLEAGVMNRISIPTLEELVLIDEFDHLDMVKFDLPNLKRFRIESYGPISTQPNISTIQPLEVHWTADGDIFFCDELLEMNNGDIRGLFLSYKSPVRFSVASFLKGNVLEVLKESSTEGVLPPRWKDVAFYDTFGGIETMDMDIIVCSDQDVDML